MQIEELELSKKDYDDLKNIALELIHKYHKNDLDKGGNLYVNHLIRVSNECEKYESKIAALLHDILEDTNCDEQILIDNNIPIFIIDIINIVTRKKDENYIEFINRIIASNNRFAIEVKYKDLKDNCDLTRLDKISDKEFKKMEKMIIKRYVPAIEKIESKLLELGII